MALQFVTKVCSNCFSSFKTSNDSSLCYNCTLDSITHGEPPEQGDFNTAAIVSGTLTETERASLQLDLESVELGRTTEEENEEEEEPEEEWQFNEQQAAKWGEAD